MLILEYYFGELYFCGYILNVFELFVYVYKDEEVLNFGVILKEVLNVVS